MLHFMRLNAEAARRFGCGDYAGAADCYQQVAAHDPARAFALSMLAQCQERQGQQSQALATAMKAVAAAPDDFLALRTMARACVTTGDPHTAKLYVERALAAGAPTISAREVRLIRFMFRVVLAIMRWVPHYRRRVHALSPADLDPNRDVREWTAWAHDYLAWYAKSFPDSGPSLA